MLIFLRCRSIGHLSANSFGEFFALLAWDVYWEVLASLVRNLPALRPWHLLLNLLWHLLAMLLGHLGTDEDRLICHKAKLITFSHS